MFDRLGRVAKSYANSLISSAEVRVLQILSIPRKTLFCTDRCWARHKREYYLASSALRLLDCPPISLQDPEKMLDQTVNEMSEDLIKMRQASAQV
eukprot:3194672-Pyramimonas_sp.AAC.1